MWSIGEDEDIKYESLRKRHKIFVAECGGMKQNMLYFDLPVDKDKQAMKVTSSSLTTLDTDVVGCFEYTT